MSGITFQRLWKVSVGQYTDGGFKTLIESTEHRFTATISADATDTSGTETAKTSVFRLYNIGYDYINLLSSYSNLYLKVQAGYLYNTVSGSTVRTTPEDLPVVYLGNIFYSNTNTSGSDLITTIYATPAFEKVTSATCNLQLKAGVSEKEVFKGLSKTIGLPHKFISEIEFENSTMDRTIEGSSCTKLKEWCDIYQLRNYVEKGVIYFVDKSIKRGNRKAHYIPQSLTKGIAEVSIDLSKVLKEKTKPAPNVKVKTFLYPQLKLHDSVTVEITDFKVDRTYVDYFTTEEFVVDKYTHNLDTHGSAWDTTIEGKGGGE